MASPSGSSVQTFNGMNMGSGHVGSSPLMPPRLGHMTHASGHSQHPLASQIQQHNALFAGLGHHASDPSMKQPYPSIPLGLNGNPFNGLCRQVAAGVYPSLLTNASLASAAGFNSMFANHLTPQNMHQSMGTHNSFQSLLATLSSLYGTHPQASSPFGGHKTDAYPTHPSISMANNQEPFPLKPTVSNGSPLSSRPPTSSSSPLCLSVKEGDRSPDFRNTSIAALRQKAVEHAELSRKSPSDRSSPESK